MVTKTDNNFEEDNSIIIRGARQHNLNNIDLTLPRNKFIVFVMKNIKTVQTQFFSN